MQLGTPQAQPALLCPRVKPHAGDGLLAGASQRLALVGLEAGTTTGRPMGRPPRFINLRGCTTFGTAPVWLVRL
jgi:hypothetical protein